MSLLSVTGKLFCFQFDLAHIDSSRFNDLVPQRALQVIIGDVNDKGAARELGDDRCKFHEEIGDTEN